MDTSPSRSIVTLWTRAGSVTAARPERRRPRRPRVASGHPSREAALLFWMGMMEPIHFTRLHAAARDVTEDLSDEEKMRRGMHQSPARTRRQERLFTVRSEAPPWLPKTGVLAPLVRVEEITYSLRQSL